MIRASTLCKRYGTTVAVDDLSFTVPPGQVTGFLGPNGAGKSTTMRMIMGLDAPTSGTVTVNGRRYLELPRPLLEIGALLDASATHRGRSAFDHLLYLALSNGIRRTRVDEVLELVGLRSVARKRVGGFSLGMSQRLGIAAALLGDPPVLIFDEPINGLDPEGVLWLRNLMRTFADEGRTVLLSSHLMSEMAITADRLIIIGRGRLIAETTTHELLASGVGGHVHVRSPDATALAEALRQAGAHVEQTSRNELAVTNSTTETVGAIARDNAFTLLELSTRQPTLEETYMALTKDAVDYHASPIDRAHDTCGAA